MIVKLKTFWSHLMVHWFCSRMSASSPASSAAEISGNWTFVLDN